MAGNLDDFDASSVAPQTPFDVIPAGNYPAVIVASEMTPTKDGAGEYLKLTIEIIDGAHKGRKFFDRLNLKNANQQAVDIARATLSAICHATKVMRPGDSAALHDIPMSIKVTVTKRADNGEPSNEIRGYKALGETGSPAPAASSGATPATKEAAPWKKKA